MYYINKNITKQQLIYYRNAASVQYVLKYDTSDNVVIVTPFHFEFSKDKGVTAIQPTIWAMVARFW